VEGRGGGGYGAGRVDVDGEEGGGGGCWEERDWRGLGKREYYIIEVRGM